MEKADYENSESEKEDEFDANEENLPWFYQKHPKNPDSSFRKYYRYKPIFFYNVIEIDLQMKEGYTFQLDIKIPSDPERFEAA